MALAGPEGSLVWAFPAGHKDIQVGSKVGLEKVVLAGCRVVEPGYTVNPEHEVEPQEQVNVKGSHGHRTDMEKHTRVYHPMHNAKNTSIWDLERTIRPRGSIVAGTIDTPPERCSPA